MIDHKPDIIIDSLGYLLLRNDTSLGACSNWSFSQLPRYLLIIIVVGLQ